MSFKKNKYKIIKNAIPIDVANFVHDYFVIKRNVFATLKNSILTYLNLMKIGVKQVMNNVHNHTLIMLICL